MASNKALAGQTAKATEDIGAQISGMQHATMRSIEAIGAIERTIRNIGDISGAIAAAVTEQCAATQEIARSVETAAERTSETAEQVVRVGEATAATRASAISVKTVAEDLGAVASRIRGQVDYFFREKAARRLIDCARVRPRRRHVLVSNAAGICCGIRHGATSTASNRISRMRSSGWRASQACAAANNAPALTVGDRPGRFIAILPRLDLDEDEQAPAPCDDIDLADRALPAARQDAKALDDEQKRRPALG